MADFGMSLCQSAEDDRTMRDGLISGNGKASPQRTGMGRKGGFGHTKLLVEDRIFWKQVFMSCRKNVFPKERHKEQAPSSGDQNVRRSVTAHRQTERRR